ncbi:MAG: hypothetical protein ACIAQZ_16335 [Sedimentisphaeraceae bacterium JB056]
MKLVCILLLLVASVTFSAVFSGGSGAESDPYQISTAAQLDYIGTSTANFDKHYILINDIDLSAYTGTSFHEIGYYNYPNSYGFTGSFDGNGFTIDNFEYDGAIKYSGFFSYIDGGTVKNLNFTNAYVSTGGQDTCGVICGFANSGSIINCSVSGSVSGDEYIGGIIGTSKADLQFCSFNGTVTGRRYVGGIAGNQSSSGGISGCYANVNLTVSSEAGGGIAGKLTGQIEKCFTEGTIQGGQEVGGIAGYEYNQYAVITNCYSAASVTGSYDVGGIVGLCSGYYIGSGLYATLTNCYFRGTCNVGPIFGHFEEANVSGLLYDSDVFGSTSAYWEVWCPGKTTPQMQQLSTFTDAGWDFSRTGAWRIREGDYPILDWQPINTTEELQRIADFASQWMSEGAALSCDMNNDSIVNYFDWTYMSSMWGQ